MKAWFFYVCVAAKSLQSCPTLCDPIDGSPPGSTVPGILQARTLEWVAISFSNAWKWKVKVKLLSHVRLSNPMDCSPPGSSVHGIFQARVLEWGAIAFSDVCVYTCICIYVYIYSRLQFPSGKGYRLKLARRRDTEGRVWKGSKWKLLLSSECLTLLVLILMYGSMHGLWSTRLGSWYTKFSKERNLTSLFLTRTLWQVW